MLFVIHYTSPPERRDEIMEKFKATGGLPPEGVKMLGRWTRIGGGWGFCVAETDDSQALAKWAQDWSNLMTMEVHPVLDDEGFQKLLS